MSIDGAVRTITPKRREELGELQSKAILKLKKMRIEQSQVAAAWRQKVTTQMELCEEIATALEVGKEQVDARGEFLRAPEGSENQLELSVEGNGHDGGDDEPRPNSPKDIGFGPSSKRRGVRRQTAVN